MRVTLTIVGDTGSWAQDEGREAKASVCCPEIAGAFEAGPSDERQSAVALREFRALIRRFVAPVRRIHVFRRTASELGTGIFVQTSGPNFYRLP